jgi:hypothetical protein
MVQSLAGAVEKNWSRDIHEDATELEPWCSGFDVFNPNERELYEAARESRLRDLHGSLLDTIGEREAMEREVLMVAAFVDRPAWRHEPASHTEQEEANMKIRSATLAGSRGLSPARRRHLVSRGATGCIQRRPAAFLRSECER